MFHKKSEQIGDRETIVVSGFGKCSLTDTLECGQAFRYERTSEREGYVEYMTVIGDTLLFVGQREAGELIFYTDDRTFEKVAVPYFTLNTDYQKIKEDILSRTDSEWLMRAADAAEGVVILRQEPWETLFSFIISQNNNIPRIRKIIRAISAEYGENLAIKNGLSRCPLGKCDSPSKEVCRACGSCYSFPTAESVVKFPEGLLPSHPGFRYKYLLDAAEKVYSGEISLEKIAEAMSYEYTLEQLKRIKGVGDKVASCAALFGFGNLEAFPVDVWMKRAIDVYFDGVLDHTSLGKYAGVAQQYIFHYIRNLEKNADI